MGKTFRGLWEQIASFDALHAAYLKARRGKRFESETLCFSANLEEELLTLLRELETGAYRTGAYRRFNVYEPKKREVAALPFRDRVVQHALVAVLELIYERRFIYDSYACRVGKGTHAGVDRLTQFLRQAHREWGETYVLKVDVSKYFPNVDHVRLKEILRRYVACTRTLRLVDEIIDSWNGDTGKGIPIGNLTSQLFANVYLHELDEFIKRDLHCKMYVRYMDDLVILGPDKVELHRIKHDIAAFLKDHLLLSLNPKTAIYPEAQGVSFLGYRMWRTHRLLKQQNVRQMKRRLMVFARRYHDGQMDEARIRQGIVAWIGHAKHAETFTLRKKIFDSTFFSRTRSDYVY